MLGGEPLNFVPARLADGSRTSASVIASRGVGLLPCKKRGSAWLRPWVAPFAIMVAAATGALSGRVFRLTRGIMPPVRSGGWSVDERRVFEEAGRIVGVCPCGRGEDKGDKARACKHMSFLRAISVGAMLGDQALDVVAPAPHDEAIHAIVTLQAQERTLGSPPTADVRLRGQGICLAEIGPIEGA